MATSNKDKNYAVAVRFADSLNVIYFEQHFYYFHEGVWRMESDENTRSWIIKEYKDIYKEPPTDAQVKEITKYICHMTYEKYRKEIKYFNSNINISTKLNMKSGILDLNTLKVRDYKKSDFCFWKLPFDYNPDYSCPVMMKFLTSSMGYNMDDIDKADLPEYKKIMCFIQEWMGYSFVGGNRLEKALIIYGEGGNGKSVLQNIWEHIIGSYNCSYVDLKYINDGSQVFMTRNKLVNFCKDLESGQQLDTGIVKTAISGGKMISNEKYKGQIPMDFTAKFVIACNELPFIKNASNAIKRRFHILPFTKIFEEHEQDKDLLDKLKDEAEHIFSWAVTGYKNLMTRGCFDTPELCGQSINKYIKNNDVIQIWIDENCSCDENCFTKTDRLFADYAIFCDQSRLKSFGKVKFYERLEAKGFKKDRDNAGIRCYRGIKLIND